MTPKTDTIRNRKMLFYERKFYRVIDNSFQRCLSDGLNYHLAGTQDMRYPKQTVEIIQGPYQKTVTFGGVTFGPYDFIIGKCRKGLLHEIVFFQCGLVD